MTISEIQLEQTGIAETSDKEESRNILEERCYLRIKCTAANSLAALMWRRCLNSGFQPYSYYMRTYKKCLWDKYPDQPSRVHVEGGNRRRRQYKMRKRE